MIDAQAKPPHLRVEQSLAGPQHRLAPEGLAGEANAEVPGPRESAGRKQRKEGPKAAGRGEPDPESYVVEESVQGALLAWPQGSRR